MTKQPDDQSPQNVSAEDFFGDNQPANLPDTIGEDIAGQLKHGLKQAGQQAGTNFIIETIVNILPLPYAHKRNITRKINSGQPVTIWDVVFGGFSIGRVIRFIFSIVVFLVIAYVFASRGLAF